MESVTTGAMAGKEVICVEYPGVVQNTEAMLDTLGGTLNLCKVFTDKSRRMELRYAHPATSRPFLVDSSIFYRILHYIKNSFITQDRNQE